MLCIDLSFQPWEIKSNCREPPPYSRLHNQPLLYLPFPGVLVGLFNPLPTTSAICNAVLPLLDGKGCIQCKYYFKGDVPALPMGMNFIVPILSVQIVEGQGPMKSLHRHKEQVKV